MPTIIKSKTVFFDFDGVIKDSMNVKSLAFEQIFSSFGQKLSEKIKLHNEENGGMSRFDKLPIYFEWTQQETSKSLVEKYAEKFSLLVKHKVINSDWVDGILSYLENNNNRQQYFLVTATPQQEIEDILGQLKIAEYFKQVIGSPTDKKDAIQIILKKYKIKQKQSVMIGDSSSDYEAATANKVPFVLRKTNLNKKLQKQLNCKMIEDFINE